jgi:hypothetical protein
VGAQALLKTCTTRLRFCANRWPQEVQAKGRSPVCTTECRARLPLLERTVLHTVHGQDDLAEATARGPAGGRSASGAEAEEEQAQWCCASCSDGDTTLHTWHSSSGGNTA